MTRRARGRRTRAATRTSLLVGTGVVVALLLTLVGPGMTWSSSAAAFVATDPNAGNVFSAAASFPTFPSTVAGDHPLLYYRLDDAQSSSATSAAADSSGHGASATYNGATDGMSTWWRFEDRSGTAAADSSGAANPGTLGGGATFGTGRDGAGAVTLDGSAAGYVAGARAAIDTSRSWTVSLWARPTATSRATAVSQSGTSSSAFAVGTTASGKWRVILTGSDTVSPTTTTVSSTGAASVGTWTHVVAVYDTSLAQISLYVNGSLANSASAPAGWNATGALQVGRRWTGSWSEPWTGDVDDVRLYQRALSSTEISGLTSGTEADPTGPKITAGLPGALQGPQQGLSSSTAVAFAGATGLYQGIAGVPSPAYSSETWFRVSGNAGGAIRGFATDATGTASTTVDRVTYIDSGGHLSFGVLDPSSVPKTLRSPLAYNDDAWHDCVMSLGPAGMKLYVDGVLVASDAGTTAALSYSGYARVGGMNLAAWPNRPAGDYLTGTVDEVAYYTSQLSDQDVAWHYHANH